MTDFCHDNVNFFTLCISEIKYKLYTRDIFTFYQLGLKISISILLTSRQHSNHGMCKISF